MSRSGYTEDCENDWSLIRWRGAVASAIRGARGQAMLKELLVALDSMENKRLIYGELIEGSEVCALGALGNTRGLDMSNIDPEDRKAVAAAFGVAPALAAEIMYMNDDWCWNLPPERRFQIMRQWVEDQIKK